MIIRIQARKKIPFLRSSVQRFSCLGSQVSCWFFDEIEQHTHTHTHTHPLHPGKSITKYSKRASHKVVLKKKSFLGVQLSN